MHLVAYLASKPVDATLVVLWVAVILFAVAAVMAAVERAFVVALVAAGLTAFTMAFLVS